VSSTVNATAPARGDSWYLDPVVARQKAESFLALYEGFCQRGAQGACATVLKTDLFEEANGEDALVARLASGHRRVIGVELDLRTASRARRRFAGTGLQVVVSDARRLGLRTGAIDRVVSPSTLDHFSTRGELETALDEIARVVRPGGTVVVILDNPWNPLYYALRAMAPLVAPFHLGRTLGPRRLAATLERLGFDVLGHDYAIHNPRGVLTLVNLLLRATLGRHAERPIRGLVRSFALLDRLPTRPVTACFVAVGARRRPAAVDVESASRAGTLSTDGVGATEVAS
jgi:SAM-dependent methyltransferase